jgi:hypothetical protein
MNKNKYQIILMCVLFFLIVSCDSLKRGLTNQKEKSTDEFLVKKKDPLIFPPDYQKLPSPEERVSENQEDAEYEKLILGKASKTSSDNEPSSGSLEKDILKRINKN